MLQTKVGLPQMKLLLITNAPTPYRVPLFNELHAQLDARGIMLRVVFASMGYGRRLWTFDMSECRFDYAVLGSRGLALRGNVEHTMFAYTGLRAQLDRFRPDLVIVTGFSMATMQLWRSRRPYIIWTGSLRSRSPVRRFQRKVLVRGAAGFIAYGTRARDYLIELGAPADRISIAINTVDTQFFRDAARVHRDMYRLDGAVPRFLYVGYLTERKRVDRILDAAALLARTRADFIIDIVGDGDARASLEAHASSLGLRDRVVFHGYRQRHELPELFARSRCLLFSSEYEVWGLVLNEAMASGIPAIASVSAGATDDLIVHKETGFAVDFADPHAVAGTMEWMLDHSAAAAQVGTRAQRFIDEHASIRRSAGGFIAAVDIAVGSNTLAAR